ncbi:MAG: homoserine O-succinyltransferase [Bacillota bacterium]|nr:homoserine O-succinyltransferase [Bacillota bacterium]
MPIRINENMPVVKKLENENIFVMPEGRAAHQDIRQLHIAIVNIMPEKESTELQLLRLLSNSPLQTDITFVRLDSHCYKNISEEYLQNYYKAFAEVDTQFFDGLIITGAPVENLPFEQVDYWQELCDIMEWSKEHVTSTMYICWAAQAGLYHHYGLQKYRFENKLSGIYEHKCIYQDEELTRGFDDVFYAPHSRYTGVHSDDIRNHPELKILAESQVAGAYLVLDKGNKRIFVNGHPEYSADTLAKEYRRDLHKHISPEIPTNYFEDDNPWKNPVIRWRGHSNLLFSNWLNYYVYQVTPFDPFENKILYNI